MYKTKNIHTLKDRNAGLKSLKANTIMIYNNSRQIMITSAAILMGGKGFGI